INNQDVRLRHVVEGTSARFHHIVRACSHADVSARSGLQTQVDGAARNSDKLFRELSGVLTHCTHIHGFNSSFSSRIGNSVKNSHIMSGKHYVSALLDLLEAVPHVEIVDIPAYGDEF